MRKEGREAFFPPLSLFTPSTAQVLNSTDFLKQISAITVHHPDTPMLFRPLACLSRTAALCDFRFAGGGAIYLQYLPSKHRLAYLPLAPLRIVVQCSGFARSFLWGGGGVALHGVFNLDGKGMKNVKKYVVKTKIKILFFFHTPSSRMLSLSLCFRSHWVSLYLSLSRALFSQNVSNTCM
jgi:hypothetical protein